MKSRFCHDHRLPNHECAVGAEERPYGWAGSPSNVVPCPTTAPDLKLLEAVVPHDWVDYNGHMTEYRYLQVLGETTDALLRLIGADLDYVAAGHSYYTVETHIRHLREAKAGDSIQASCQLLASDEKRLHVFHTLINSATSEILATGEHLLLHVNMAGGKACAAKPQIIKKVREIEEVHRTLPRPAGVGRHVAQKS